jgi:hypothetical protein
MAKIAADTAISVVGRRRSIAGEAHTPALIDNLRNRQYSRHT